MDHDEGQTMCRILKALVNTVESYHIKPKGQSTTFVTAKIRLPETDKQLRDRLSSLLDTGIHGLTIHGRTILENKTKVGACHTNRLRRAVEWIQQEQPGFPVIVNGGVEYNADVGALLHETGAAAVMSSEALLEAPNVFFNNDDHVLTPRQQFNQQIGFARDYLQWCTLVPPLPGVLGRHGGSFNIIRGHLFKFLHRYLREHVDLRDRLGSPFAIQTIPDVTIWLDTLVSRYQGLTDDEFSALESAGSAASWYRRHRQGQASNQMQSIINGRSLPTDSMSPSTISVEARKQQIRERIAQLQSRSEKTIKLQ
jgi:tRNA-dihydrouridine synthase